MPDPVNSPSNLARLGRGLGSAAAIAAMPLGGLWRFGLAQLTSFERLEHGLAVVLPGIEGPSPLNWGLALGLADGGWPGAVVVHDWTTGWWPLGLYHLRGRRRNRRQARVLAERLMRYQDEYPGRPVYLLGHSGGGALAVWTLEALPPSRAIAGAVLLAPALSHEYFLGPALVKLERGLWNFWSPWDLLFLAAGTSVCGTFDGRHQPSSGWRGFQCPTFATPVEQQHYEQILRQSRYRFTMARQFNLGGHFGCCNRVFAAETLAPLLAVEPTRVE